MNGLWALLVLILIAAFPVLLVYIWFRVRRFPLSLPWFILSLLAGALSLGIAALMQGFFPQFNNAALWVLLVKIFVQIALLEEAGRFAALAILFNLGRRFEKREEPYTPAFGAATGLLAGLGFAVIETASYGVTNAGIALIRAFTSAPLHGACGSRVGSAALALGRRPLRALLWFFSAVAIHGMYNFLLVSPGAPAALPILIALAALFSSIRVVSGPRNAPL
jgi:RsiW-degrading membrane proteinase PrsW (M82 family)